MYEGVPFDLVKYLKTHKDTLKDLDFINLNKKYKNLLRIKITDQDRRKLIEVIEKDVKFLCDNELMDYSVLMGIEIIGDKLSNTSFGINYSQ